MTTNSTINEMFEDIKDSLKSLEQKLDTQIKPNNKTTSPPEMNNALNHLTIERILKSIEEYLKVIYRESNSTGLKIQNSESKIIKAIEEYRMKQSYFSRLKTKVKIIRWTFVFLLLLSVTSITSNIYQYRTGKCMKENNLKYRLIRDNQGISEEELIHLDSIFSKSGYKN